MNIANEVSSGDLVSWDDALPILIIMVFTLALGLFAFGMMMREWAWLSQWEDDLDDYDSDIEIVSSQQGGKTLNCVAYLQWGFILTYVVTSACVNHKYQDCVAVCPVDAFRELDTYLVIDPDDCIDCNACVPECPVDAIYHEDEVPDEEIDWIEKNEEESVDAPLAEGDSPVLGE